MITWQSVQAPSIANETKLLNDANQNLASSIGSLGDTILQAGNDELAKQEADNKKKLEYGLQELAGRTEDDASFKSGVNNLLRLGGVSGEEAQSFRDSAAAYREDISSLSSADESSLVSELSNAAKKLEIEQNSFNSKVANDRASNNFENKRKVLYGEDLGDYNSVYRSVEEGIEDNTDKQAFADGVKNFRDKFGYDEDVVRVAMNQLGKIDKDYSLYSNIRNLEFDGVDAKDVSDNLEYLVQKVISDREKLNNDISTFDNNVQARNLSLQSKYSEETNKINKKYRQKRSDNRNKAVQNLSAVAEAVRKRN